MRQRAGGGRTSLPHNQSNAPPGDSASGAAGKMTPELAERLPARRAVQTVQPCAKFRYAAEVRASAEVQV